MLTTTNDEYLWTEKYRPQEVDDCVLSAELDKKFKGILKKGEIPNMIFASSSGTGKTTMAYILCKKLGVDYMKINGSDDNGIDVLRNKIKQFASSMSLDGGYKVVIIDEADYLTSAAQAGFRSFIEEFSNNCRFIFTCNFPDKLMSAAHSRLPVVFFNTPKKELPGLCVKFMKRMQNILENEKIEYDKKILSEIIIRFAPDWRRIIGEVQGYSVSGTLNPLAVTGLSDENMAQIMNHLKMKDFNKMRSWVANNVSLDGVTALRKIYDCLNDHVKPGSIPGAVVVIADYTYKSGMMADKELNLIACLTELMAILDFK